MHELKNAVADFLSMKLSEFVTRLYDKRRSVGGYRCATEMVLWILGWNTSGYEWVGWYVFCAYRLQPRKKIALCEMQKDSNVRLARATFRSDKVPKVETV